VLGITSAAKKSDRPVRFPRASSQPAASFPRVTPDAARRLATVLRPQAVRWASDYVDAQDAEDVAQTALEVLLRRAEAIHPDAAYEFLRVTVWRAASSHRRAQREVLTDAERPDPGPDPEVTLASAEVSQAVRDAVARMPESRRRVVVEIIDGRTVADVARDEGIPESTARDRLRAGEDELRADLTRQRAAEKRKSGSTSWMLMPWAIDVRTWWRRATMALGASAAVAAGGALLHTSPTLQPTSIDAPARVLDVDTIRPVTSTTAERGVDRVVPARPRARHDVGARMLAERMRRPE
jgi:RNA polymerase sigma factor (sigma-70 family)